MIRRITVTSLAFALTAGAGTSNAEDIEIFLSRYDASGVSSGRAKVLIIVDNSGSMAETILTAKPSFDPGANYLDSGYTSLDPTKNFSQLRSNRIYWSDDGVPPRLTTNQWVLADSNHCAASQTPLSTIGNYNDYVAAWWDPNWFSRGWYYFNTSWNIRNAGAWECQRDVDDNNSDNLTHTSGFPCNTGPNCASAGGPWDDDGLRDYPGTFRNLYTANYMAWYYNGGMTNERSKMAIAQEVLSNLVDTNPNVDFGLMTFNQNGEMLDDDGVWDEGRSGGRVIRHLSHMEDADRTAMIDTVNQLYPVTNTPLCETLYEAFRYLAKPSNIAQNVHFGDDDVAVNHGWGSNPEVLPYRDPCAENSTGSCALDGTYESPLGDCEQIYIVYMTDGVPSSDLSANSLIRSLTGASSCGDYTSAVHQGGSLFVEQPRENCMPELAEHMFQNDLDDTWQNGDNIAVTFTVGFQTDQQLLEDTAERGGGKYFTAADAVELNAAFQKAVNEILSSNTNFAAPAVAVDAFNRTRSLDDLFYSMFRPYNTPRWPGNIKKLIINNSGEVLDRNGTRAIDEETGNIKASASTYWTTIGQDGMNVETGGAGALLADRDVDTRTLLTNTGSGDALEALATSNAALTVEMFEALDETERDLLIQWVRGVDVDDEDEDGDITDTRPWIIGDLIHSRPLAINYGGATQDDQDVRIVFGTNAGFVHMIDSADGTEDWAFFAKETAPIVKILYENSITSDHPYGIDGSIASYMVDANEDGAIASADGDKAHIFFGMRRGGSSYYGMDVTDPGSPAMLWRTDENDLSELGQTWAEPEVTYIPGYDDPVVIVSAGYDTNKDFQEVGTGDTVGRGLYILDAEDGSQVWSATPGVSNATNRNVPGLIDSVPAEVTAIDGNSDGIADRLYFGDTGGNVWRIDMVGEKDQDWTVHKLASLGGNTTGNDRRIFNRLDVVSTRYRGLSFDAVVVGTGNRSHPLEVDVGNRLYVLRDFHTRSAIHIPNDGDPATDACASAVNNPKGLPCAEVPAVITEADLVDVTANLIQQGTDEQKATVQAALSAASAKGWYIALEDTGEKSLSRSITLKGTVFFTSYVPPDPNDPNNENICRPSEGAGYLYAVALHDGSAMYPWGDTGSADLSKVDRRKKIKSSIPDHAVAHFGDPWIRLVGVGAGTDGKGSEDTGLRLSTDTIYWYENRADDAY
ncbi:MAG: hypothetical protein K9L70_09575 [Thiohalocapsa sp.]|nr:hypothetical protein [Thiohalocapsa sp.]